MTLFFLADLRVGLRGLKGHYELKRYPYCQINIVRIDGKYTLIYRKWQSKTRQEGINDRADWFENYFHILHNYRDFQKK